VCLNCGSTNAVYNQYTFDANGNVLFWDDKESNTYDLRFTYDGLDRLDNIRKADQTLIGDMNYDTMGNITKFDSIAGTINYAYDASTKRLQSTSGMRAYDFSYDERGNVTDNGYHSFTYNLAEQMTEADGNTYLYDGHNKRVKTIDGTGTRYSMYSLAGKLVYERINGANRQYFYLGSQLVAHQGAGEQAFIHPDLLGTTAAKSNSSGGVTKRLRYAPFGLEWGKTNAESGENEIGYTGHKHDKDIGLTYMQARYYDPVIGRFYSNDPIGFRDMHSFNRYAYANNNPYKYVDPTGMFSDCSSDPNCSNLIGGPDNKESENSTSGKGAAAGAVVGGVVGTVAAVGCDYVTIGICTAGNPAIITGSLALGAVTGAAIERAYKQLDKLISKMTSVGPTEFQYALVAKVSGLYPNVRGGSTFLNAGDVYKYGTTNNPDGRYPLSELLGLNVNMVKQFEGTRSQTLVAEKIQLIEYAVSNLTLPPGNRIFK
jgi:RHS repeat-associated protein